MCSKYTVKYLGGFDFHVWLHCAMVTMDQSNKCQPGVQIKCTLTTFEWLVCVIGLVLSGSQRPPQVILLCVGAIQRVFTDQLHARNMSLPSGWRFCLMTFDPVFSAAPKPGMCWPYCWVLPGNLSFSLTVLFWGVHTNSQTQMPHRAARAEATPSSHGMNLRGGAQLEDTTFIGVGWVCGVTE